MKAHPLSHRFQVGASLVPPVALSWMAARAGWLPVSATWLLALMPAALAMGMIFPRQFSGWHRLMTRVQAMIGRALLSGLLGLVFLLMVLPTGLLLRCLGRSFLTGPDGDSLWSRARPPGSLRDPF